jgi:hypothetical protein
MSVAFRGPRVSYQGIIAGKSSIAEDTKIIMTLTKKDLADHLADIMGLKTRKNKQLVETFFNTIRETLESGKECCYPELAIC